MLPFPSVENQDNQGEGPSSISKDTSETSASDELSALPQHSTPASKMTRFSPPSTSPRQQRLSFDGDLLNFPALYTPDFEISPLRKLKEKFGSNTSRGSAPVTTVSEGNSPSYGRRSIENDHFKPTPQSGRKFFKHHLRVGSDPHVPSSSLHSSMHATDGDFSSNNRHRDSRSPSNSRSRAVSPLRFIHSLSASFRHSRHHSEAEELFVPINPFKSKINFEFATWFSAKSSTKPLNPPDIELGQASVDNPSTHSSSVDGCEVVLVSSIKDCARHANIFFGDVLPRYIYLNLLLRLPALYFSRVARVFRDAEISRPDIERMIEAGEYCIPPPRFDPQFDDRAFYDLQQYQHQYPNQRPTEARRHPVAGKDKGPPVRQGAAAGLGVTGHLGVAATTSHQEANPQQIATPTLRKFKHSWEVFIDSLLKEWKTLNVVSALLASAIFTIFQIPDAAGDPVTRTTAILSLICSLMSLTYGCMYIVRFSTMRAMIRASKWAEEARRTNTAILWNVWVLLAMPAVWLAWSMLLFMITILCFVWRTGSVADPQDGRPPLSETAALGTRITVSFLVFIGFVYLVLIVRTLKSYGIHGGSSQILLTSPQARLQEALAPSTTLVGGESGTKHGALLEVAFERRGRERTRSVEVRRGRRREEVPEIREHWEGSRVPVQDRLADGNELGLYPVRSKSSTRER